MTYDFDELVKPYLDDIIEGETHEDVYEYLLTRIGGLFEEFDLSTLDPDDRTWSDGDFTPGEALFLHKECYKRLSP